MGLKTLAAAAGGQHPVPEVPAPSDPDAGRSRTAEAAARLPGDERTDSAAAGR